MAVKGACFQEILQDSVVSRIFLALNWMLTTLEIIIMMIIVITSVFKIDQVQKLVWLKLYRPYC